MKVDELARIYSIRNYRELAFRLRRDSRLNIILDHHLTQKELKEAKAYIEETMVPQGMARPSVYDRAKDLQKLFNGPINTLLEKYSLNDLQKEAAECKIAIPDAIKNIIVYHARTTTGKVIAELPFDEFPPDFVKYTKSKQFEEYLKKYNLTHGDWDNWDYQVTLMWLAAELAFKNFCERLPLPVKDLNEENIYSKEDFIVKGKRIDVKSRCKIGRTIDGNLDRNHCDPDEIIAFFHCEEDQYNDYKIKANFLGIYDPSIVRSLNLTNLKVNTARYLNPLFFLDAASYFESREKENKTELQEIALSYLIGEDQFSIPKALKLYDRLSVLKGLRKISWFGEHDEFVDELIELSKKNLDYTAPTVLFNYLAGIIDKKSIFNFSTMRQKILPLCCLNSIQFDYAKHLLDVIIIINNEKNVCQFTGVPLKDCKIIFSGDYQTIRAVSPKAKFGQSNTLLSYSWKTGETLRRSAPGIENCACGCLEHLFEGDIIGRYKCYHEKKNRQAS